jgi:hypothetical protein
VDDTHKRSRSKTTDVRPMTAGGDRMGEPLIKPIVYDEPTTEAPTHPVGMFSDEEDDDFDGAGDYASSSPPGSRGSSTGIGRKSRFKTVFIKGLFSVSTTSTLPPLEISSRLRMSLFKLDISFRESARGRFDCKWVWADAVTEGIEETRHGQLPGMPGEVWFEVTIVKVLWLFGMHGIRFRRVAGDTWRYQDICKRILTQTNL